MEDYFQKYRHWQYKNTALLILSLIALFYLASTETVQNIIGIIGNFGYLGAFLSGFFLSQLLRLGRRL